MKATAILLTGLFLVAAIGCEKPKEPEQAEQYDREIDGPVCMYAPASDPDLLADQGEVAKRGAAGASASGSSDASAAPTAAKLPPGTNPVASARARLQGAANAVTAGRTVQVIELFAAEEAAAFTKLLALSDLPEKIKAFEQLARDKLGDAAADKFREISNAGKLPPLKAEAVFEKFIDVANLTLRAEGDDVIVTRADGTQAKLVYTDNGWKYELDAKAKQMVVVVADMADGLNKLLDTMTAGINDGSITAANFDAKGQELSESILKPVAERFLKLIMDAAGPAAPDGPTTTGTTTPPPAAPGPAPTF